MHQANTRRSKFMRSAPQGRCGGPTVNICDVQGIISLAASRDDVQGGEATFRGVALRSLPPCTNPCTQQALHRLLYHACSCLHGTIGWTFGLLLELLFCDQPATMNTNGNSFGLECAVHNHETVPFVHAVHSIIWPPTLCHGSERGPGISAARCPRNEALLVSCWVVVV